MKKFLKDNWKYILFFTVIGLIGGVFAGLYSLESYSSEMLYEIVKQIGSKESLVIIATFQSTSYALILGTLGIYLSKKVGLWNKITEFKEKPMIFALIISLISGLSLIIFDLLIFNNYSPVLAQTYSVKPTLNYILMAVTYGGIMEEVMMRLFLMSLLSLIIYKIFYKKKKEIPGVVFIISNIIVAIIFAAGHLPATEATIGITAPILIRCFLLNGIVGLMFGWLYRKYGIQYAMVAHIGCHIVSKLIWILFI